MRVPWNVPWLVKPVLDAGAMGIIVPMTRSAAEALQAARAVRYPPTGERGFGPFYAPARFGLTMQTYADPADREILCILLIEHKDAIDDIEAIVGGPGRRRLPDRALRPRDELRLPRRPGAPRGPGGDRARRAAILNSPVHLGGLAITGEIANAVIARGYRLILIGFDTMLLQRAAGERS